ncbi:formin-like protein 2 [Hemibagrus wyckioides]|uniref:formin-like protein 2 n=1 Tax=Hemibagrus wyckioides TaxID=337641 RepID=UPI00266C1CA2|nr:formin-like protein 2 [Hemibagrus wyckioides]XP_058259792.1 formin-like protein 2 [Hemibagrus wyckioides]XP_058259804.1 formin-like protein 2 [Hemibagrus wyckioides]
MNFRGEDALQRQEDADPQPGWTGLYDPWTGRLGEQTRQDELNYSEQSDSEDEEIVFILQQDVQDGGDENEVTVRSSSPVRSPSPPAWSPSPPMRVLLPVWDLSPARSPSPPIRNPSPPIRNPSPPIRNPSPLRTPIPIVRPTPSYAIPPLPIVVLHDMQSGQPFVPASVTFHVWRQRISRRDEEEDSRVVPSAYPVLDQGKRWREEEEDDEFFPSSRRQRVEPEWEMQVVTRPLQLPVEVIPALSSDL